jgi:hypothetical protein
MIIEDGKGTGSKVGVRGNEALVSTMSAIQKATLRGDAYAWNSVSADIDATDVLISVRNLSNERLLVINRLYVWVDVATALDIHTTTSSTAFATGTAVTGVNLNTSSNKVADAEGYTDDDGVAQGSIICTLHTNETATDVFAIDWPTNDGVILGTNGIFSCDCVEELGAFEATVIGYFID